jgi:hypothetical protein
MDVEWKIGPNRLAAKWTSRFGGWKIEEEDGFVMDYGLNLHNPLSHFHQFPTQFSKTTI